MEEDCIRTINEDPGLQQVRRDTEERERAAKAEERARQEAADQERRKAAEVELEDYRRQQLQSWIARGGHEDDFEEAIWPEARAQYLRDKAGLASHEERLRRSNLSGVRL